MDNQQPKITIFGGEFHDEAKQVNIVASAEDVIKILAGEIAGKQESKEPKKPNGKRKQASSPKQIKPRELMTFGKHGILEGHLKLLFMDLVREKWIEGKEESFMELFSGTRSQCYMTWKKTYGKENLVYLFKEMIRAEHGISLPGGYSVARILEGHFKDESGQWLTNLDKCSDSKVSAKLKPIVANWVNMMQMEPQELIGNMRQSYQTINEEIDNEFAELEGQYDVFDQQDLHWHKD